MECEVRASVDDMDDRELSSEAVFSISSAKPGNGVEQLRDNCLDTYWQSDGTAPHTINIQFMRKTSLTKLCIYLDHSADDSYTPKKIVVGAGSCSHDVAEIAVLAELADPTGWIVVDLEKCVQSSGVGSTASRRNFLQTYLLQIKVLAMHQNGKDTHVRQVKVYGTRESPKVMADLYYDDFKTEIMSQYALLR